MTLTTSYLGQVNYLKTVQAMQDYTAGRDATADEVERVRAALPPDCPRA